MWAAQWKQAPAASVDILIDVFRYATRYTRATKLMCVVLFYFVVILHLNSS